MKEQQKGFPSFWSTFNVFSLNNFKTNSQRKCKFIPLSPLPPNFIARLKEFERFFSNNINVELSQKIQLLISLANGHPRTLEIIHEALENKNLETLDFNSLFREISSDISSMYTIGTFMVTKTEEKEQSTEIQEIEILEADFLYHFVVHAFFVPQENFSRSLEELPIVEVLVAKAIIVDSITKKATGFLCSAHINLFMFCYFWDLVKEIAGSDLNWVINLNDLITFDKPKKKIIVEEVEEDNEEVEEDNEDMEEEEKVEDESISVEPVFKAFMESEKFEQYFPLISTFRFNLLVNPICNDCAMKLVPQFTTLCSFFGFSDIPFLNGQCSTFYNWEIDFSKPFSVNNKEINNSSHDKKKDKTLCNKEKFKDFLESDKWDDNVNIWYKCEKNFVGIDNFCFIKLRGEFFFFFTVRLYASY